VRQQLSLISGNQDPPARNNQQTTIQVYRAALIFADWFRRDIYPEDIFDIRADAAAKFDLYCFVKFRERSKTILEN
jgi:hypothetical protein